MKKKIAMLAASVLLVLCAAACGAKKDNGASQYNTSYAPAAAPQAQQDAVAESYYGEAQYGYDSYDTSYAEEAELMSAVGGVNATERKVIKNGSINLETDNFDDVVSNLRNAAQSYGGYVESSYLSTYKRVNGQDYRSFDIVLRVPSEDFTAAKSYIEGFGGVTRSVENMEDATAAYYDANSRLQSKLIEEERVLDMITRATKAEDLLALEERLGIIRADIELLRSRMINIDRLASFSTLNVYVTETDIVIPASATLSERMSVSFTRSVDKTVEFFQNAMLFFAGIFVQLLLLLIFVIIVIVIVKNKTKRSGTNES